ncbi:MAG: hypothetical protein BWY68_00725 [bacterium ADurb.Bin400]|nr:MAG: hypothetical protein BWY68_00725 [bacterium ADurb.Bin400]
MRGQKPKSIVDIDLAILDVQRSTKTVFRGLAPSHEKLRMAWPWYYK